MDNLIKYGWNDDWQKKLSFDLTDERVGRVVSEFGNKYKIAMPEVVFARYLNCKSKLMPKVGDWVIIDKDSAKGWRIIDILPRNNELVRGCAGDLTKEQVMAVNVDLAFVVQSMELGLNLAKIERYLFQLATQNIKTIVILNKIDLAKDINDATSKLECLNIDFLTVNALNGEGVDKIIQTIGVGETAVILGPSGAGKSSIVNCLLGGHVQAVDEVRKRDLRGRHTTVRRELFLLPNCGMMIDSPGIKELQLWGDIEDLNSIFSDIINVAYGCKYGNCSHTKESGCAIKKGLKSGLVDLRRFNLYLNFKNEIEVLAISRAKKREKRVARSKEIAKKRRFRELNNSDDFEL